MSEVTHTPPPWRVVDVSVKPTNDDDGIRFFDIRAGEECRSPYPSSLIGYIDCGGHNVAQVMKGYKSGEADARLISAAPELLEALEDLCDWGSECTQDKWDKARAAIAKARGQS